MTAQARIGVVSESTTGSREARSERLALLHAALHGLVTLSQPIGDDDITTAIGQALLLVVRAEHRE
jgi:hypothetical protein